MSRDQRSSFRFTLPEGQDRAILRVGWRNFPVRVLNASATGFMLVCPLLEISRGEALWLRTTAAWTEIRVVFVEHGEEGTRLGVERLRELEEAPPEVSGAWFLAWLPGGSTSGGAGNLVAAISVLAAIVAGAVFLHREWNRPSSWRPSGSLGRSLSSLEQDFERACTDTAEAIKSMLPRTSGGAAGESRAASSGQQLVSDVAARLPNLLPEAAPRPPREIATNLGLDESQQRNLGGLFSSAKDKAGERLTTQEQQISKNPQTKDEQRGPAPRGGPPLNANPKRSAP
jgi:hypothetical protein